ncbi:shikimate dehydrogenase [Shewanella sp. 202IG2-18]|uniref:shikimate dehydrogenase n=1 Tax=Parashewanella hymeniacidonis TaxID=2807618 RepID=UPI0019606DEB|nr:shikimate dehydrogenase [Parashewanella hymeniacidonis]MBM7073220.1 shikimate dehydrogenase [Parashewanella hymeniacidonis]
MADRYAVIGNPVEHSQSPFIHAEFAKQTQQSLSYEKLYSPLESFKATVEQFKKEGGLGANVTVPFKEQALTLCDELSDTARAAGAVNTLSITAEDKLKGDNTDGYGLVTDLKLQFGELTNKRILILGAGGATRGCILPLLNEQIKQLVIANRTKHKAKALVEYFNHPQLSAVGFDELSQETPFDLIINATAASLTGEVPSIPVGVIHNNINCYDMVYSAKPTAFLVWAKQHKANNVADGLGMLVHQAANSFRIWLNVQPDAKAVLNKLRENLK